MIFIDASQEFAQGTNQNKLRDQDIEKVVATYKARRDVVKYAAAVGRDQIVENEFNLNILRYVETFEDEKEIDLPDLQIHINEIDRKIATVQEKIAKYLAELGV